MEGSLQPVLCARPPKRYAERDPRVSGAQERGRRRASRASGTLPAFTFVPMATGASLAVGVGLFTYFNHRRHHPHHDRYLAQENTHFAVIPDALPVRELRAPTPRLLSKGDSE
jgi:hypothetical protein